MKKLSIVILLFLVSISWGQIEVGSNGNVGIGTTPGGDNCVQKKLSIINDADGCNNGNDYYIYGIYLTSKGQYHADYNHGIYTEAFNGVEANYGIYAKAYGSDFDDDYAGYFSGDLVYTGSFYRTSDIKLKENIVDLESVLAKMKTIQPKKFNYKSGTKINSSKGKQYGLIAQDVEKVFPELVKVIKQVEPVEVKEGEKEVPPEVVEYKAIDYIELIPILFKAINEQQQQIEEQRKLLEELQQLVKR